MKEFELKNNIKTVYRQNKNTPRVALSLNLSINEPEKIPGIYSLMSRLLLQGTTTRNAEKLAQELDENAIELFCDMKQDYLRFRFLCLNEDVEKALEILSDIIKNTTFEEFEKEKIKMQGEIIAELDSARTKAFDNYYKTIFKNHFYGNSYTKVLENLEKIQKEDVVNAFGQILATSKKILSFVGDFEFDYVEEILNKNLSDINESYENDCKIGIPVLEKGEKVEIIKKDAQQAQIIKGWLTPTFGSEDYPTMVLLNIILGSAGLSSRLFLELREKKGLAYHVRSTYETNKQSANFFIFIATEPKNVQICLDGFEAEIKKLKEIDVCETELEDAKNNLFGKQQFVTETNSQQANQLAHYGIMGLGFNFQDKVIEKVKQVKPSQIKECANKYFNDNFVISILRPEL